MNKIKYIEEGKWKSSSMFDRISSLVEEVYGITEEELIEVMEEIHRKDILKKSKIIKYLDNGNIHYENTMKKIEELTNSKMKIRNYVKYSHSKNVKVEKNEARSFYPSNEKSGETFVREGFDYSPKYTPQKRKSKKDMLLEDVREAILSMSESGISNNKFKNDIYTLITEVVRIGMLKQRPDYVEPYKERRKKDRYIRENAPDDSKLAEEWGYESPSEIN